MPSSGGGGNALELKLESQDVNVAFPAAALELLQTFDVEERRIEDHAVELAPADELE